MSLLVFYQATVLFPRLFCRQITAARVKYFRKKPKQAREVQLLNHLFLLPSRIPGVTYNYKPFNLSSIYRNTIQTKKTLQQYL